MKKIEGLINISCNKSREYGIPCVSGLIGIMDIVKDGDVLEVDGYNGVVKIGK